VTGPSEDLIATAFELSQRSPKEWGAFVMALEAYVADTVKKLVASEPATLSNFQGQAVQAQHIFNMLYNCRQTMQKAETMRSLKKPAENKSWPSK
jgi:hypothetical protein